MSVSTPAKGPHLITANTDSIQQLEPCIVARQDEIETWFGQHQNRRGSDNEISIGDFTPYAVLLNNDLSCGPLTSLATACEIQPAD